MLLSVGEECPRDTRGPRNDEPHFGEIALLQRFLCGMSGDIFLIRGLAGRKLILEKRFRPSGLLQLRLVKVSS